MQAAISNERLTHAFVLSCALAVALAVALVGGCGGGNPPEVPAVSGAAAHVATAAAEPIGPAGQVLAGAATTQQAIDAAIAENAAAPNATQL